MKILEIGKDYISEYGVVVIDRLGAYGNRGFDGNDFEHDFFCRTPENWHEATESEVIEAFEKHLPHRFGEDWRTMKIKEKHPEQIYDKNTRIWNVQISKRYNGWNVWNKNGLLYCNGIWVERLEEKKIHIKEAIKERTVIHCETIGEADRILKMAIELGYAWNDGRGYRGAYQWGINKSKTCYHLLDGMFSDYDYFKKENFTIIPSTQIAELKTDKLTDWTTPPKDFEYKKIKVSFNADKKRYEVIKTTFSDFKQLSLGDNKTNKVIAHFVNQDEDTLLLAEKIVDILNLMEK